MTLITSTGTSAFYDRSRADMTRLRAQSEKLQAQIGSGSRLTRSSDDPVAASRLRNLARADAFAKVDSNNANRAAADLSLADSTMSDITDAIGRAKVLATQAATGTISAEQRAYIGEELAAINDTLFALANTKDSSGHALFGGENATSAYARDAAGNAVYAGTARTGELPLAEGQSVTPSLTGPEFLNFSVNGTPTDLMATMKTLADALQSGTADAAGAANSALTAPSSGLDAVTTGQTVVGARLAWIELSTERSTTMSELRADEKEDVGGVDKADAIVRLQEVMLALEASQASFAKLSGLSLFNQLN